MTRLWERVAYWAQTRPDAEAVVFEDSRISWRELNRRIDLAAKALLDLGVRRGGRVAMISMAQPEFLVTWMAASKIGALWLGLTPKFSEEELDYILRDASPDVVVTVPRFMGVDLRARVTSLASALEPAPAVFVLDDAESDGYAAFFERERPELDFTLDEAAAAVAPEDDALLMYTSGSTGRPKGVVHTHASILNNVEYAVQGYDYGPDDRMMLHFPINHVAALIEMGYSGVYAGSTLIMMDTFNPLGSLETIEKERVTMLGQVPLMYLMQLRTKKFRTMDWSAMRVMVWGASGASLKLIEYLKTLTDAVGARLLTGYGSTEVAGLITATDPAMSPETLTSCLGKPFPNCEVKIVDDNRQAVPAGAVGELAVRGGFLMKEYLGNIGATAAVLDAEGWYYTRDLCFLDEDGNVHIAGRASEMYKTAGENVYPREVENVLEEHPGVAMAAVIGVPNELYGEVGHAFVMPVPGTELTEKELRAHCREHLVKCKTPKKFDLRAELPLLANGKVNKPALKAELGLE